jgi:hypothetical protein
LSTFINKTGREGTMKVFKRVDWAKAGFVLLLLILAKLVYWDCYVAIFGKICLIIIYVLFAIFFTIVTKYKLKGHELKTSEAEDALCDL